MHFSAPPLSFPQALSGNPCWAGVSGCAAAGQGQGQGQGQGGFSITPLGNDGVVAGERS